MTPELRVAVERIRALAEKATPGQRYVWWAYKDKERTDKGNLICAVAPGGQVRTDAPGGTMPSADADYIAAVSPDVVLKLCAALERSELERAVVEAAKQWTAIASFQGNTFCEGQRRSVALFDAVDALRTAEKDEPREEKP